MLIWGSRDHHDAGGEGEIMGDPRTVLLSVPHADWPLVAWLEKESRPPANGSLPPPQRTNDKVESLVEWDTKCVVRAPDPCGVSKSILPP